METIKKMQTLLRYTFGLVPIVAGLDKFTNLLVDWPRYLGSLGDALSLPAITMLPCGIWLWQLLRLC